VRVKRRRRRSVCQCNRGRLIVHSPATGKHRGGRSVPRGLPRGYFPSREGAKARRREEDKKEAACLAAARQSTPPIGRREDVGAGVLCLAACREGIFPHAKARRREDCSSREGAKARRLFLTRRREGAKKTRHREKGRGIWYYKARAYCVLLLAGRQACSGLPLLPGGQFIAASIVLSMTEVAVTRRVILAARCQTASRGNEHKAR